MAPAPEGQVVASSRCPPSTHGGPPVTTWGVITSGRGPALTRGHAASTLATATTPAPQRRHELTLTLPLTLPLEETRTRTRTRRLLRLHTGSTKANPTQDLP